MQRLHRRSHLFGLSIESEIDMHLPETSGPAQVHVVLGTVKEEGESLFQTKDPLPFACYRRGDAIVLTWPDVRFQVTQTQVIVDSEETSTAAQLLVPAAWSVVLAANGRESLHGAAAERDGYSIGFMGYSGSGKTTAVLNMIKAGWKLMSDDLLTFDSCLKVIPGPPWMRVVPSLGKTNANKLDVGGKIRTHPLMSDAPTPLSALVILAPEYKQLTRLTGTSAVSAILQQVYNPVLTHPGQVQRRFDLAHDLADRAPIFGMPPRSFSRDTLLQMSLEGII